MNEEIRCFDIGDNRMVVEFDTNMILLRSILDEVFDLRELASALHEFLGVVPEGVGSLHGLQHLLKSKLLSFPESVVEFNSISLVLLVFGYNIKVVLFVDRFEEVADIALDLLLLRPQHLLLSPPPILLLAVVNHKAFILHLAHSKMVEPGLIDLDEVED